MCLILRLYFIVFKYIGLLIVVDLVRFRFSFTLETTEEQELKRLTSENEKLSQEKVLPLPALVILIWLLVALHSVQ